MNIKKLSIIFILFSFLVSGCHHQKQDHSTKDSTLVLNEQLALDFAHQIENSVLNENPDFFNKAFDKDYIKAIIGEKNSIVASAFDTQFGREAFDNNFRYGDFAVNSIQQGGDVRFIKYYEKNGQHHIIFRIYNDFGLKIDDFVLGVDKHNQVKIQDGFIYNMSTTLTDMVLYDLLYCTMMNTEPDDAANALTKAEDLFNHKKYRQLRSFLDQNKKLLQNYPYYNFLYINTLNETSKNFIHELERMQSNGLDIRCRLVHELIYYTNMGSPDDLQNTILQLMNYTEEDPIYWVFYAKSLANAKQYQDAIAAYENAEKAMPSIWDIWEGKLQCFYKMYDDNNFQNCLSQAKEKFDMTDSEVKDYVRAWYPRYISPLRK